MTTPKAPTGNMDPDAILSKVRKLIQFAEHDISPDASPEQRAATEIQQQAALDKADALMLTYSITKSQARQGLPEAEREKPSKITIQLTDIIDPLKSELAQLLWAVCDYTRTKAVVFGLRAKVSREMEQYYRESGRPAPAVNATIYGFTSDLKFFELIWTTISLHLIGGLNLKWDSSLSMEDNAYVLHNAGFNWLDMARMYPDNTWPENGEPATMAGSRMKRAYQRACRDRGEPTMIIQASGRVTFRRNYVQAFRHRINSRFAEAMSHRQVGAELVLRSDMEEVNALYDSENKKAKEHKAKTLTYNPEAQRRGRARADTADIGGARVGNDQRAIR